ncbi:hypothetical protein EC9_39980 [Rosistilla ulvae]|uniref:DUF4350 domain-containing protein n=1 Tax=Rosistilla ulvae TaxID=1930277 RepID=A0A517M4K5_9BACT|nr:hypothetical protein [Rosistilla ulvae]QDS89798.1 hypothetical protein EC9_39980 [Rosistilla ulvae]
MNRSWGPWGLFTLVLIVGSIYASVTRQREMITAYGYSYSHQGTLSINGTAAFREMYTLRDWDTQTIKRLSNAADQLDTIVWFPDAEQVPSHRATAWLDRWLSESPRTLVFVARGFDSTEPMYWRKAMADAPPQQRLEYRRRQARTEVLAESQPQIGTTNSFSNGWFTLDFQSHYTTAQDFGGPWAEQIDPLPQRLTTRATIRTFDPDTDSQLSTGLFRIDTVDEDEAVTMEPLLTSASGDTLAARLKSERWPDSQVLVLSTAECLLNLSLTEPANRALADRLIKQTGPPSDVGFLRTDMMGARVQGDSDDDLAAGMELLTQWPLSMTTMHVVLLGFIAILALLPIFGRPRRLPPPATGDFGEHVSAVAELLQRSGDTDYARQRISEYFVQVRGEESGPWVLPTAPAPEDKPPGDAN